MAAGGTIALINGNIYASFKPLVRVKSLAIVNGTVMYVGNDEGMAKRVVREYGGEYLDLGGDTVIPGFIDAHIHINGLAITLKSLNLRDVRSISELRRLLRDYIERNPNVDLIYGRGWDQENFVEGRWPTRFDIDDVIPDKPVVLMRVCGHVALLNTKAMEELGLLNSRLNDIVRDERGVAIGIVKESLIPIISSYIEGRIKNWHNYIHHAIKYLNMLGVTTVGYMNASIRRIKDLRNVLKSTRSLRVYAYLDLSDFNEYVEYEGTYREVLEIKNFLNIKGVKIFADGTLGARTALLSKPYADDPFNKGQELMSADDIANVLRLASSKGYDVAVHAIGDGAVDNMLSAYRKLCLNSGCSVRVEHASVVRPDQIKKLRRYGVRVAVQPRFILSDWWVIRRVGIERASWVYPFKSLLVEGVITGFSSDAPVEPPNPFEAIYAAITRGMYEGIELYKYTRNEVLSIDEALDLHTSGSAQVLSADRLGKLLKGYKADFIILDNDPLSCKPECLRKIKVVKTFIDGVEVFNQLST